MVKYTLFVLTLLLSCTLVQAAPLDNALEQNVEAPAFVKADSIRYDAKAKIVEAEGNVEIAQDKRILLAKKLIYNQTNNQVTAIGDVTVLEPNGQVYFAKDVTLKEDMKTGVIADFRARLKDQSRFAANSAQKIDDNVTQMEQAVYSPCKLCKKNPEKAPLWQIKADKVKLDDANQEVTYGDAQLELYGLPILYSPYFAHPTPGADNKSGFLAPTYSTINTLGAAVQVPYYLSIAPNMDATLSPIFTSDEGAVMTGEFRHLTENGKYQLEGSVTRPDRRDEFGNRIPDKAESRGHVEGEGRFNMENDWAWGFSGKRASDDTYLRRYNLGFEDSLTSTAYLNQIKGRNFIGVRGLTFQGLNLEDDPATTPFVLPLTHTHHEFDAGYMNSRFLLDSSTMVLYRSTGAQSRRLSVTGGYQLPFITDGGHVFELNARLRSDIYSVEDTGARNQDKIPTRFIPEVEGKWSYPLMQHFDSGHMTVEPIVTVAASPYGGNPDSIPNEDSQNFELNELNLFSANKFTGYDRLEEGPRASYGVRTSYTTDSNKTLGVLLGQSYRLKADNQLYQNSGLEDNLSHYVGRVDVSDSKWVDASYSFRLSEDNAHFERSEISGTLLLNPLTISTDYIFLNRGNFRALEEDREEISGSAAYKIAREWTVLGNVRRGLGQTEQNGGLISSGLGLLFENECIGFNLIFNREYTRDRDIEPSTSVVFQVTLANLN